MNRKRRIGLIGLMLAISMCGAWASWAQTQNPAPPPQEHTDTEDRQKGMMSPEEYRALEESRVRLSGKLKELMTAPEAGWKLKQEEFLGSLVEQVWKRKDKVARVWVQTYLTEKAASNGVEMWVSRVSAGTGNRFEGLGDEAAINCGTGTCVVSVRKGKVTFSFLVKPAHSSSDTDYKTLVEIGKGLCSLALTIDDPSLKEKT